MRPRVLERGHVLIGRAGRLIGRRDVVNSMRRHLLTAVDRAIADRRFRHAKRVADLAFDGEAKIAVIIVNFSTTTLLKLLAASLTGQSHLTAIRRLIVVDNGSRDGGIDFLRKLARTIPRCHLVERHHLLDHAHGLRAGLAHLRECESELPPDERANVVLFCDSDIAFLRPDAVKVVAAAFEDGAHLVGELRGPPTQPDIQASFLAVRRDVLDDARTAPIRNCGSPTAAMQCSIAGRPGVKVADIAFHRDGYIIHRGRGGVSAAAKHHPLSPYRTASSQASFMGLADGPRRWRFAVGRWACLRDDEAALIRALASTFSGPPPPTSAPRVTGDAPLRQAVDVLRRRTSRGLLVSGPIGEPIVLRTTALVIWEAFAAPTSLSEATGLVADVLSTSVETIESEVCRVIDELVSIGALTVAPDPSR